MPKNTRKSLRDFWYRGAGVATLVDVFDPFYGGPAPRISYRDPPHAKTEFVHEFLQQLPAAVVGPLEPIQWPAQPATDTERALRAIVNQAAPFVRVFPDASLLRVRTDQPETDLIFTILRNRAHLNIDFMFREDAYLVPKEDTLHVLRGIAVSRPNLMFSVRQDQLEAFIHELRAPSEDPAEFARFVERYGVTRNAATFWSDPTSSTMRPAAATRPEPTVRRRR